jgi:hypothetical protein
LPISAAGPLMRRRLRVPQVLPLNEMAPGQASPSAVSDGLNHLGSGGPIDELAARRLDTQGLPIMRGQALVDWSVRTLKDQALRSAFRRFVRHEWAPGSERKTPAHLIPRRPGG